MNRFEIYYNVLLGLLNNIVNSASTTPFYNALPAARRILFTTLTEPIRFEVSEIVRRRRLGDIYEDFTDIKTHIESFRVEFGNYPNLRINQLKTALLICERVSSLVDNRRINSDNFVVLEVPQKIKPENFLFHKPSLKDSVLMITLNDEDKLEQFLSTIANVEVGLCFYFLSKLSSRGRNSLVGEQYVLVHTSHSKSLSKITSLIKLASVCEGQVIHIPFEITRMPLIIDKAALSLQKSYTQFLDSIYIFSEYNYEKDILNKYLRLYHVIENFMFKKPIVDLMQLYHGDMFSIRNFKTLYSKVDKTEPAALEALFKAIFTIYRSGAAGSTLKQSVQALWNSLSGLAGYNQADIDSFLSFLGLPYNTLTASTNDNILNFYCKLIYYMRNSIVHNKETEHHILHSTLNPVVPFLLNNFLFPSLEEICFKLIIETNASINYTYPSLRLYEE